MRQFINGSGSDSSAAVRAYLASRNQFHMADFYVIRTAPCYVGGYLDRTFKLTDYSSPLKWDYKGTFGKGNISRNGVESKMGLEADTVQVTWTPQLTDTLDADLTVLQGFPAGVFDDGTIEIWRVVMPEVGTLIGSPAVAAKAGDCNSFGACLMFAGRIGNFKPDRLSVQIDVVSRIETLNVQVPTNLIEPTNILAQYTTGQFPTGGPTSMSVVSGSTKSKVYADDVASPMVRMPAGTYDFGYIKFGGSSKLSGHIQGVRAQTLESGHHAFYLYGNLPLTPTAGDTIAAFIPVPRDYATALTTGNGYVGFPYCPTAISSSVVIA